MSSKEVAASFEVSFIILIFIIIDEIQFENNDKNISILDLIKLELNMIIYYKNE